jgi:hypothetical protein
MHHSAVIRVHRVALLADRVSSSDANAKAEAGNGWSAYLCVQHDSYTSKDAVGRALPLSRRRCGQSARPEPRTAATTASSTTPFTTTIVQVQLQQAKRASDVQINVTKTHLCAGARAISCAGDICGPKWRSSASSQTSKEWKDRDCCWTLTFTPRPAEPFPTFFRNRKVCCESTFEPVSSGFDGTFQIFRRVRPSGVCSLASAPSQN